MRKFKEVTDFVDCCKEWFVKANREPSGYCVVKKGPKNSTIPSKDKCAREVIPLYNYSSLANDLRN